MDKITWQETDDGFKAEHNGTKLIVQEAARSNCWNWDVTKPMRMISHGQHNGDIKTAMLICELVARAEVEK